MGRLRGHFRRLKTESVSTFDLASKHRRAVAVIVTAIALTGSLSAQAGDNNQQSGSANDAHGPKEQRVCAAPGPRQVECLAHVEKTGRSATGEPMATSSPTPIGLTPTNIQTAYGFSASPTAGAGQTIAIVDAYDAPTVESDLATFSDQYALPACTTANGCFTKVNQTGGSVYPQQNGIWAFETDLDVQWAHAVAPGAKILLVESNTNYFDDMVIAEDYAASQSPYVSNSWGALEFAGETAYDNHFTNPNVNYFFASGDSGATVLWPSANPNVVSVGGTNLSFDATGAFQQESAWAKGGGGCSGYEHANASQVSFSQYANVGCTYSGANWRATPDVSLDADPASGVSVFDSQPYYSQTGWWQVGGTSAATPMWAARAAAAATRIDAATIYGGNSVPFRDITSGSTGYPAVVGFDMATGRGSWNDTGGTPPPTTTTTNAAPPLTTTTSIALDKSAPSMPGNVVGSVINANEVDLSWNASTDNVGVSSYDIYRSNTKIASVTSTNFTDTTVVPNKSYNYVVYARDAAANKSSASKTVAVATPSIAANLGSLTGRVSNNSGSPLSSAKVSYVLNGSTKSVSTSTSGNFTISSLPPGANTLTVSLSGYVTKSVGVSVVSNSNVVQNVSLAKLGSVTGVVTNSATGLPVSSVKVSYSLGTSTKSVNTNSAGTFTISSLPPGSVTLTFSASGYLAQSVTVTVSADTTLTQNISLVHI